jgi:hypothetical protein
MLGITLGHNLFVYVYRCQDSTLGLHRPGLPMRDGEPIAPQHVEHFLAAAVLIISIRSARL